MVQSNKDFDEEMKRSKKYDKKVPSKKKSDIPPDCIGGPSEDGLGYRLTKEKCPVCGELMHEAPGIAIYCDNPACPVEDDSYYYETGQKKGKVGDGKRTHAQMLIDMARDVKALGKTPLLCRHPSFAIVSIAKGGPYQLFCYECRTAMPFFFYSKKEWDELGKKAKK